MIQNYALSLAYLFISFLLLVMDSDIKRYSFLLRFRSRLEDNKKFRMAFSLIGFLIGISSFLFPIYPGPVILGDFFPSALIIFYSIFFAFNFSKKADVDFYIERKTIRRNRILGLIGLSSFLLHFFFPSLVLL